MNKNIQKKIQGGKNKILSGFVFLSTLTLCFNADYVMALDNSITVQSVIEQKRVTLNIQNKPIKFILSELEKITGIGYAISGDVDLNSLKSLSINVTNQTLEKTLDMLLSKTGCNYKIDGNIIVIVKSGANTAAAANASESFTLKGSVVDAEDQLPLVGATIMVKGTATGVSVDAQGKFELQVKKGNFIDVALMGYQSQTLKIVANKELKIELKKDAIAINDVVVNGYFSSNKKTYTGAAKTFSKEDIRKISNQNVLSSLSVIDPSFKMVDNNLMGSDPNNIPNFTIRGGSDFNSVVDGTKGSNNMPLFVLDGFVVSAQQIYDLDPNRVENITILKDATATAVYGSRASNGVVIVETIKLQQGKIRFTYTGDVNFEMPDITCYNVLNAREKLDYEVVAGLYKESGIPWFDESKRHLYNERRKLVEQGYNTDWLNKPINKLGIGHKHTAIIDGGDDAFSYAFALNYEDKIGVMKNSNRERLGINVKMQYRFKNIRFKNELAFQRVEANSSPYGSFSTYVGMNPYYKFQDEKGDYLKVLGYSVDAFGERTTAIVNPLYNGTLKFLDKNLSDRLWDNFQFDWDITSAFKFKTQFSISKTWGVTDMYKSDKHTDFENYPEEDMFRKGQYTKGNSEDLSYSLNAVASFNKSIGNSFVSVNAGMDIVEDNSAFLSYSVEGISDIAITPSLALQYIPGSVPSGDESLKRSIGFFLNANYSWNDKYFVDGSYRTDASSIYGKNSRWGGFWSMGAGWNIHNESFMKDVETINFLKLRSSTGITGGQNFSAYQSLKTYVFRNSSRYENWQGVDIVGIDNPNLKWQRNHKTNIGVDLEMFNSRLKVTADYYWELSKDNMTSVSLAPSVGFDSFQQNLGGVMNRGVEFSVNYRYLDKKDFSSTLFLNLVSNVNKIQNISDELVAFNKKQDSGSENISKPSVRYIEGESLNTIWVVRSLGIDPATGDELFLNRDGVVTKSWSAADYVPYGCSDPKLEGTFGNTFTYKRLQLNFFFNYRLGSDIYNSTLVDKVENSDPNRNVDRRAFDQGWKTAGDVSFFKRPGNTKTNPTSRFVERENYLKLSSINVAYYLPEKLCKKVMVGSAKVTLYMNDIFTLSSVKQERGIIYPFARNIAASLQLTF